MKRYLAFFGDNYYPEGGMNDFAGDFDTYAEAMNCIEETLSIEKQLLEGYYENKKKWCNHWADVYDTKERKTIFSTSDL